MSANGNAAEAPLVRQLRASIGWVALSGRRVRSVMPREHMSPLPDERRVVDVIRDRDGGFGALA